MSANRRGRSKRGRSESEGDGRFDFPIPGNLKEGPCVGKCCKESMRITCCHFGSPPPPHSDKNMEYCNKCKDWWDNITGISSSSRSLRNSRRFECKETHKSYNDYAPKIIRSWYLGSTAAKNVEQLIQIGNFASGEAMDYADDLDFAESSLLPLPHDLSLIDDTWDEALHAMMSEMNTPVVLAPSNAADAATNATSVNISNSTRACTTCACTCTGTGRTTRTDAAVQPQRSAHQPQDSTNLVCTSTGTAITAGRSSTGTGTSTGMYCMPTSTGTGTARTSSSNMSQQDEGPAVVPVSGSLRVALRPTGTGGEQPHDEQIQMLRDEIQMLRDELMTAKDEIKTGNNKLVARNHRIKELEDLIFEERDEAMDVSSIKTRLGSYLSKAAIVFGRRSTGRIFAEAVANVAWNFMNGVARPFVRQFSFQSLRERFSAINFMRMMDMTGGGVNYSAANLVRELETQGKKYARNTIIPSTWALKEVARAVERIAKGLVPFEQKTYPGIGEAIVFDVESVLQWALEAYGLMEIAQLRSLSLAISIDGARITNILGHVLFGMKINDLSARDPITGELLVTQNGGHMQSRDNCIPLMSIFGKETKEMYTKFKEVFETFTKDKCERDIILPNGIVIKKLKISVETDMSGVWKGLLRGGAFKVCDVACYCCPIKREEVALNLKAPASCPMCIMNGFDNQEGWKCFHHEMVTDKVLESKEAQLEELRQNMALRSATHEEIKSKSQLKKENPYDNSGVEGSKNDPMSIWFEPPNRRAKYQYSILLRKELELRGEEVVDGPFGAKRDQLKPLLMEEHKFEVLHRIVTSCKRDDKALFLLLQALPCILHMEMRVGIKMFTLMLVEGLKNAMLENSPMFPNETSMTERVTRFLKRAEQLVNEQVFGEPLTPGQWQVPYDQKDKSISAISMTNTKVRKIVKKLHIFADFCVLDIDRRELWKKCIPHYIESMVRLRDPKDMTDDEAAAFQKEVDLWYQDWQQLHGETGVTNYIHMLHSGHIYEYLKEWRNLSRHSQQGWEALNSLIKFFFFRFSQKGGGRHGNKSKLRPVALWLQRRMMWMKGVTDDEINAVIKTMKEEAREKRARKRQEQAAEEDSNEEEEDNEDVHMEAMFI